MKYSFFVLFCAFFAAGLLAAEGPFSIERTDGTRLAGLDRPSIENGIFSAVSADGKTLSLPLQDLRILSSALPPVDAKPTYILLKSGILLSGILRVTRDGQRTFRSTTFGELQIPDSEFAGFVYDRSVLEKLFAPSPIQPPFAIAKNGTRIAGKILWANDKTVAVSTKNGLKKLPTEEVSAVIRHVFILNSSVILRNDDRLTGMVILKKGAFQMDVPLLRGKENSLNAIRRMTMTEKR